METIKANFMVEPGIGMVQGDVRLKNVRVAYSSEVTSSDQIKTVIDRLGYRVERRDAA